MPNHRGDLNVVRVDPELVSLARAYLDKRAKELSVIERALAQGDYRALHRIGHNLHGSGQMFGFDELTAIGVELQQAVDARDGTGIRRLRRRMADFLSRTRVEGTESHDRGTREGSDARRERIGNGILLVDDDEMNRILIAYHLEKAGYVAMQCANGEEALAALRCGPLPALILLDVLMGTVSGLEVCRHIKSDPSTCAIPVILLTALERDEDRMWAMQAGADDFLTKPVTRSALLERVSVLLPAGPR